ncbi:HAMP domain-containing histidine kinase [bacterium]|nr:HAMP domain-containing histidine kinase [bacterium]
MFRSATLRLTVWYTIIIMAVSLVFSTALYIISRGQLESSLRRQWLRRIDQRLNIVVQPNDISADLTEGSARLLNYLLEFNLIILALSVFASYKLARHTLEPIEEAHTAQARFTADASHELRTPLTAMKAEIEVALRDKKLTIKEARELLNSNLEEVSKLELLSNALLKLAQTNRDTIALRQTNALEVVSGAVERVKKQAQLHSISIKNDVRNIKFVGDSTSLTELFVVLLDNAIKYSPEKSVVTVTCRKSGGCVAISVEDKGAGIPAKDLPNIFDRFYRVDNSRSKLKTEGYGLGLSIAKKVADLHGGSIEVTSTVGKGSVFTVKLPIEQKK